MASEILNKDLNYVVFTKRAKAGLEERRVDTNAIWVKDCKSILETKARLK